MADRAKVYISIGEWEYHIKYSIPYTGYVIGVGYAYVIYRSKNDEYNADQTRSAYYFFSDSLSNEPNNKPASPFFNYNFITEQHIDTSLDAIEESIPWATSILANGDNTDLKTIAWAILHPITALEVGKYEFGSNNISTSVVRFATRDGFNEPKSWGGEGGDRNAFRHALWQGYITNKYGYEKALAIGNVHEEYPNLNTGYRHFKSLSDADRIIDLLNNVIGRDIGRRCPAGTSLNKVALEVLDVLYEDGLYVAHPTKEGTYYIDRTTISEEQYLKLKEVFLQLNYLGRTKEEQRKKEREEGEKLQQMQITWGTMK